MWFVGIESGGREMVIYATRLFFVGVLGLACLTPAGCGRGLSTKVLHGSVTCGGERVPLGEVSFVPVEGTSGPTCAALIVDGQYRIEARGGVPLGKHRVCVDARKKTGRKVWGNNGLEMAMIDETVRMGPAIYADDQSPLVVDVHADSDGQFDIAIRP